MISEHDCSKWAHLFWTSCRGSIEALLCGKQQVANLRAYYRLIKSVPLVRAA
ncbi:MAG: hypothetical protein FWH56_02550 [Betaproteobacteria bacterium]|nr:hypothetical protein [Betaproteobacteria bacterium]